MPNIQTATGFKHAALDLSNPDPAALVEWQNLLKSLGFWSGNLGDPVDLSLVYATGAYQRSFGYGSANPVINSDQWYGALYANGQVAAKAPLDVGVWNSLAGARQMGVQGVIDPNSISASPPGAIGALPGTITQQGQLPATPPPAAPTPPASGASMQNAFDQADAFLNSHGLGENSEFDLRQWAHDQMTSPNFNSDVFVQALTKTPAYQERFGAVNQKRQAAGLPTMSPDQILSFEASAAGILSDSGAPSSFYDNWRDWQDPIGNGWSLKEVQDRADIVKQWTYNLPPEVRQVADSYFGTGNGDTALFTYAWDPDKAVPLLQHQLTMSEIGGAAQRLSIGIDRSTADTLASLGVDYGSAQKGFGQIDAVSGLFSETVGEQTDFTKEGTGVAAVFGTAPGAQQALEQRRQARQASVAGGGSYERSQRGITGLGAVG